MFYTIKRGKNKSFGRSLNSIYLNTVLYNFTVKIRNGYS